MSATTPEDAAVRARWVPVLNASLAGRKVPLPYIRRRERLAVLRLWVEHQDRVAGDAHDRLNAIGRKLGLDRLARKMLRSDQLDERRVAIGALGHLRVHAAWASLTIIVQAGDSALWHAAARSLVQIDADAALNLVGPVLATSASLLASDGCERIICDAEAEEVAHRLGSAAVMARTAAQPGLVRLLASTGSRHAVPSIRRILSTATDPQVIAACADALAALGSSEDIAAVEELCSHPSPLVRHTAERAIARRAARHLRPRREPDPAVWG